MSYELSELIKELARLGLDDLTYAIRRQQDSDSKWFFRKVTRENKVPYIYRNIGFNVKGKQ